MNSVKTVLLTGAAGFIARAVHSLLREMGTGCVAVDKHPSSYDRDGNGSAIVDCDLTDASALDAVFDSYDFDTIIHLAAVLPGAAAKDPIGATEVNVGASVALLERAVSHRSRRFVFSSSTSVYGTAGTRAPISEQMPAAPIDVYGAGKRAVEIIGETLQRNGSIEFISLRIATVIGPGARNTSSPWRSEIFEKLSTVDKIALPYAQDDPLTVVHVDDVARMLVKLASAGSARHSLYNSPAELLSAGELKRTVESMAPDVRVELTGRSRPLAPLADGSRFANEFSFESTPLADSLRNALLHSSNQI